MKAHEPMGADGNKSQPRSKRTRAPRKVQGGPIGFGQVFSMVKRDRREAGGKGGEGAMLDAGMRLSVASEAIVVPTALMLDHQAVTMVAPQTMDMASIGEAANPLADTPALLMNPAQAMRATYEEAQRMNHEIDIRELRIELEPEHLGPLVVKLTVEKGKIRAEFHAREGEAVRLLSAGGEQLQRRLRELGYSTADVVVEQGDGKD